MRGRQPQLGGGLIRRGMASKLGLEIEAFNGIWASELPAAAARAGRPSG